MTTLVFGHKSPDTDSTGSPIIWAWYLNEIRGTKAEAVLLGAVAGRVPGVKIEFDAAACTIKGSDAAAALVKPKYRAGWEVADLG